MEFAGIGPPSDTVSTGGARQAFAAALGEAVPLLKTHPRKLTLGAELAQRFAALLLFENAKNKTF
jgi:hypothetical protein